MVVSLTRTPPLLGRVLAWPYGDSGVALVEDMRWTVAYDRGEKDGGWDETDLYSTLSVSILDL